MSEAVTSNLRFWFPWMMPRRIWAWGVEGSLQGVDLTEGCASGVGGIMPNSLHPGCTVWLHRRHSATELLVPGHIQRAQKFHLSLGHAVTAYNPGWHWGLSLCWQELLLPMPCSAGASSALRFLDITHLVRLTSLYDVIHVKRAT